MLQFSRLKMTGNISCRGVDLLQLPQSAAALAMTSNQKTLKTL